jgi:amino acid permease
MERQEGEVILQQKTSTFAYINAFFLIIASVLGTGILGLPVKLSKSGFTPFVASYGFCFLMQVILILFMTEIMQRGKLLNIRRMKHGADAKRQSSEDQPLINNEETKKNLDPDLHTLGELFLNKFFRIVFDAAVMLHAIAILTSYVLAGSESYGQLIGIKMEWVIGPFWGLYTLLVIFGSFFLQHVISFLTFGKGSMLGLMVVVTALVGYEVNLSISTDWRYVGKPFLIGTVALGGAINILPVVFAKIALKRRDIILFIVAAITGLFFVWALNVLWCYYILLIVPQTGDGISLEHAAEEGDISTVPLIQVIKQNYPQFFWVAILVDVFIMLSITVSYITVGTGTKHVLDGFVESWRYVKSKDYGGCWKNMWRKIADIRRIFKQMIIYTLCFGIVLVIAVTNPQGFIRIIENAASLALNLEAGAFIAIMLINARDATEDIEIPFKLNKFWFSLRYIIIVYFLFAVLYDIASLIAPLFGIDYL